ncbi:MAG: hypothetical protein IPP23_06285 [Sphingomonadales bacterium]|nr:hypothetical protein [Sphingomonadales bacterium]
MTVDAAPITATPDTATGINGATGGNDVVNAYTNDTLNGAPVNPAAITGTVLTPATPINGGPVPVLDPATGLVDACWHACWQLCHRLSHLRSAQPEQLCRQHRDGYGRCSSDCGGR